jgi:hypothetical protein
LEEKNVWQQKPLLAYFICHLRFPPRFVSLQTYKSKQDEHYVSHRWHQRGRSPGDPEQADPEGLPVRA